MSLLSSLERFQKHNALPSHAVHPFATAAHDSCARLQDIISATDAISRSLSLLESTTSFSNPKLVSLLRQHSSIEHTSHSSDKNISQLIAALRERSGISYGESIPLLSTAIPDWCIDQLAEWGTSVGMETFKDENREGGGVTVVLGGKVLVIDVDFSIKRDELLPRLNVTSVKTSNALVSGNSHPSTSALLDTFLLEGIRKYCDEMQKSEDTRNPQLATMVRKNLVNQLRYLVLLDGLANRKGDGGIRWLTDLDELGPTLSNLVALEGEVVAASLSSSKVPLDIFLLRAHALALPYLSIPSLSFLTYLSPSAYLSLVRNVSSEDEPMDGHNTLDIPLTLLKGQLGGLAKGVTLASLSLAKISEVHLYPPSLSIPTVATRPTFSLIPTFSQEDHIFPQLADNYGLSSSLGLDASEDAYSWVLDFTQEGKRPGVVVSQSRMREIYLVVNSLGSFDNMNGGSDILAFGSGSWVDLLLHPGTSSSPERYAALYVSPTSLHPPLQLRLTAPEEPGFNLERIPVHSIKEIWAILEIVREQCWLNEILLSCNWAIEGLQTEEEDAPLDGSVATEADLQAVLAGTYPPRKIPVNVFIPSGNATDHLFGTDDLEFLSPVKPRIIMSSPERPPIPGLVEITVAHDETMPRGISVEVHGAMGSDIEPVVLEEICRRGGTLGLPGRIWASGHGFVA